MEPQLRKTDVEHSRVTTGSIASLKLVRAYPMRSALVWLAAHVFVLASAGQLGPARFVDALSFGFRGSILLVSAAALVALFDARRRRELAFLQNLGIHRAMPGVIAAGFVLILEALVAAAV